MKFIFAFLIVIFLISFQSCKTCGCAAPPISSTLMGEWEWVQTITPTRIITPAQSGYTKSLKFLNDGTENYFTFYQADSLTLTLVPNRNGVTEDEKARTVTMKFIPDGIMKFYLADDQIEFGELMKEYSVKGDTVRHFYKRKVN